ncbi:MAG: glycosyltransferase [Thermoanaerobaculum sp.]|nr:glycosyltransferase [Thermoanaerobaculum sp.]
MGKRSSFQNQFCCVVFAAISRLPFRNNLLGPVHAFIRHVPPRVLDPLRFPGTRPTGALAPVPIPEPALHEAAAFTPHCVVCLGGGYFIPERLRPLFPPSTVFVGIALSDPQGLPASLQIAPSFDLYYTQDPGSLEAYRAAGISARRLDLAVDPRRFFPEPRPKLYDLVFVGKWTPYRNALLTRLRQEFQVAVYAHAQETRWTFPVYGPLNHLPALRRAFTSARVALDVAVVEDAHSPWHGRSRITPRAFMAAACGVPVLMDQAEAIADYFAPGVEVATFTTLEEAVERARDLISQPERAHAMGSAARARVLHCHTWDHRIACLLEQVAEFQRQKGWPEGKQ